MVDEAVNGRGGERPTSPHPGGVTRDQPPGQDRRATDGEPNTIRGKDNIHRAHALTLAYALVLEIRTGMRHSSGRSPIKAANRISGGAGKTRKKALQDLVAWMKNDFGYEPNERMQQAMRGERD